MYYVVTSFIAVFGFVMLFTNLFHHVLVTEAHKKALNQTFDAWWQRAKIYDRVRLALVFAKAVNTTLDSTFGKRLISRRVILKCSVLSTGLLLLVLSVSGLLNHHPFGATPWITYSESAKFILQTTDDLASPTNCATFTQINFVEFAPQINATTNLLLVNINSNYFTCTMSTNGVYDIKRLQPFGRGNLAVMYDRVFPLYNTTMRDTNLFGKVTTFTNLHDQFVKDLTKVHTTVAKYNTHTYRVLYSIGFYVVLFLVNILLFTLSLVFCRTILREIARAKKGMTIAALVFTNVVLLLVGIGLLVLLLTFLAIPLFWLLLPPMYAMSGESFYSLIVFLLSSALTLLLLIGNSTKLVLFIALLPCLVALAVGAFSMLAVKWRNLFYWLVKNIVIRCAEKSPYAVLAFLIGCVVWFILLEQKFIHFLAFL